MEFRRGPQCADAKTICFRSLGMQSGYIPEAPRGATVQGRRVVRVLVTGSLLAHSEME